MDKLIKHPSQIDFFSLPFEQNTFRLTSSKLMQNAHVEFIKQPRQRIGLRKISYRNEILTMGMKLADEKEHEVYIKVTLKYLLVSCKETTHESLGYFAFMALSCMMSIYQYQDFDNYFWPDFFDVKTGNSKFLNIINDRKGLDIMLKPEYQFIFKPRQFLFMPEITPKVNRPLMLFIDKMSVDRLNNNGIGFCMADCHLFSRHSVYYPFLITYHGALTKDKSKIKTFLGFVDTFGDEERYSAMQSTLCKLNRQMARIALIKDDKLEGPNFTTNLFDQNSLDKFYSLFMLWQDAYPTLVHQPHTHHINTYGFRNIKMKPAKKSMVSCRFLYEIPQILFYWKEYKDYFELSYQFKVKNKVMTPCEANTAFFINSIDEPKKFYLFEKVSDALITIFFA